MNKMHSEKISTATSTSSSETRKSSKPIMEKRRRARMNASLTELKSLLLEVMKKEGNRHSKMEKADILEMTVKHLRHLQRQHFTVPTTTKEDSPFLTKYTMGFQECTSEVSRYLSSVAEVDADVRVRLLDHLATHISQPSTSPAVSSTASSPTSTTANPAITAPVRRPSSVTDISPRQSPASLTSPPSPSTTSSPQLVAAPQPPPPPPPAQIQLQLTPSLAQSASNVQSSQISVSTATPTTRPESLVAPKQITIFPADFCTASTTTATATTFTAPAAGGILSLDTSCPQIQTAKLLSGVQLITTRLPNGQMAFVLPTNLMTETQQTQQTQQQTLQQQQIQIQQTQPQQTIQLQQTPQLQQTQQLQPTQQIQQQPRQQSHQSYIPIPVYSPTSPAIPPLTTTMGGTPGVMAYLPQVSKTGVTPTASMTFMPHIFPFPQISGMNSSISHLPIVSTATSDTTTAGTATMAGTSFTFPLKLSPSVTEITRPVLLPELTKKLVSTPVTQPQTIAKREENNVAEPVPVLQQVEEEENVWRPWH